MKDAHLYTMHPDWSHRVIRKVIAEHGDGAERLINAHGHSAAFVIDRLGKRGIELITQYGEKGSKVFYENPGIEDKLADFPNEDIVDLVYTHGVAAAVAIKLYGQSGINAIKHRGRFGALDLLMGRNYK